MKQEIILHYLGGPNVSTRVPVRGKPEGHGDGRLSDDKSRGREGDATTEAEVGVMHGHKPRKAGSF